MKMFRDPRIMYSSGYTLNTYVTDWTVTSQQNNGKPAKLDTVSVPVLIWSTWSLSSGVIYFASEPKLNLLKSHMYTERVSI